MSDKKTYDLAIIGGGPAGLTASIYASRYNVNNIVIPNNTTYLKYLNGFQI